VVAPLLKLEAVEKSFSGVRALKPLDLELAAGEVLGLVGENGAGKSTLIKLLSGVERPDAGVLLWQGQRVSFDSPRAALAAGIATIHQELSCFDTLSVAENLLLGEPWPRRPWGGVDWDRLCAEAKRQLAQVGLDVSPRSSFGELSAARKQEVAIARALSRRARLLVLDEPTASLSEPEVQRLFAHLARLRTAGVAILYVSHRLDEIMSLTDRVAVLRDGQLVGLYPTSEADLNRLVRDMVGRPLDQVYPHTRSGVLGAPLLELDGVSRKPMFRDISLRVHAGEIVGLAGLVGAGRSELARAIFGLYPITSGVLRLRGETWAGRSPEHALDAGLVYVPEERKRQGLVLDHSVGQSISIGFSDLLARWGLIPNQTENARIKQAMSSFGVRATGPEQSVGTLSGGNQQKALLARWLEREPEVVLLDEPTRGVDVAAKAEIHAWIDRLAAQGKAVLMISSDLPEVLGMSDRVLVMCQGAISTELRGAEMTQHNVILAASGLYQAEAHSA